MLSKLKGIIDTRSALAALALGLILTLTAGLHGYAYSKRLQGGVAAQVMRFHVRANSNSQSDQALKTLVKNEVLEHFRQQLETAESLGQTREFIAQNLGAIERCAAAAVSAQGCGYPVSAAIVTEYFPTRSYGGVALPAGEYEALRIDIGAAAGGNWWCVMFPPLCYVDVSVKEIPEREKETLKEVLTDEEYGLVTEELTVKFKVVELWQEATREGGLYLAGKDEAGEKDRAELMP